MVEPAERLPRSVVWTGCLAFGIEVWLIGLLGYVAGLQAMMIGVAIGFTGRVLARLAAR